MSKQPHNTRCHHYRTRSSIDESDIADAATMLASLRCRSVRAAALGRAARRHAQLQIVRPNALALRTMSAAAADNAPPQQPRSGPKAGRPASSVPVAAGAGAGAGAAGRPAAAIAPGMTELDVEGAARPTTVLLIGWLGCSAKNLAQYTKMHGQTERRAARRGGSKWQ